MIRNVDYITKSNIALKTNSVLRNTYMLLSLTIFFSALVAFFSMKLNVGRINFFAMFLISMFFLYLIERFKDGSLGLFFVFVFTGFLGYITGPTLNMFLSIKYGREIIFFSFVFTAFLFALLSVYVLISRRNFNFLSSFLTVGFIVVIACIILSIFVNFALLHLILSGFIVILSSGMILYSTSSIINGGETNYISATISLYLQIYNIFISLLSIFGLISDRD